MKRVVVYLDDAQHGQLKAKLALIGGTVTGWFRDRVGEYLNADRVIMARRAVAEVVADVDVKPLDYHEIERAVKSFAQQGGDESEEEVDENLVEEQKGPDTRPRKVCSGCQKMSYVTKVETDEGRAWICDPCHENYKRYREMIQ